MLYHLYLYLKVSILPFLDSCQWCVLWAGMARTGLMGTLNAGYYVTDGGKHCQLRLWGSSGWFHFELDGRPRPLVWQSNHPSAPEARPHTPPPPPTLPQAARLQTRL